MRCVTSDRRRRRAAACLALWSILAALTPSVARCAEIRYEWQDTFTEPERQKLGTWIEETVAGVESLVGPLPFEVSVRVYRRDGAREPVPWANTRRDAVQGVNLYVDPSYPLADFRADWTAPHEFSHLVLPFVGRKNAWFAEGFASWMQYQVMMRTGNLTAAEAASRYRKNLDDARRRYRFDDEPFAAAAPRLRAERKYPVMYWGGAAYFLQIDAALRAAGERTLMDVLTDYVACCRRGQSSLDSLVAELDRLGGTREFSRRLTRFRTEPGFPEYVTLSGG